MIPTMPSVKRILLIEDDPAVCDLILRMLEATDIQVDHVTDVAAAHDLIACGAGYSAAIVDFWLGDEDAVEVIEKIAALEPNVPIVVMSGGGRNISLETTSAVGALSGAVHFLPKPFSRTELVSLMISVTSHS